MIVFVFHTRSILGDTVDTGRIVLFHCCVIEVHTKLRRLSRHLAILAWNSRAAVKDALLVIRVPCELGARVYTVTLLAVTVTPPPQGGHWTTGPLSWYLTTSSFIFSLVPSTKPSNPPTRGTAGGIIFSSCLLFWSRFKNLLLFLCRVPEQSLKPPGPKVLPGLQLNQVPAPHSAPQSGFISFSLLIDLFTSWNFAYHVSYFYIQLVPRKLPLQKVIKVKVEAAKTHDPPIRADVVTRRSVAEPQCDPLPARSHLANF